MNTRPTSAELQQAALDGARRGWLMVQLHHLDDDGVCTCGKGATCPAPAKHPRDEGWTTRATRDEETIRRLCYERPYSNWGVITGRASGIIVLDKDPRNGGDESVARLEKQYGKRPHTVTSLTGGGGEHEYYAMPGRIIVPSRVGGGALAPGVEVKADKANGGVGHQVVIPPSFCHVRTGRQYSWECSSHPDDVPLADLPENWLQAILAGNGKNGASGERFHVPQKVREGARNDTLFRLACSLRAKGLTGQEILAALQTANRTRCEPPLDADEVTRIIGSAARYEPGALARDGTADTEQHDESATFRYHALAVPELLALDVKVRWQIKRLAPRKGLVLMGGDPEGGKSWLGLDMAIAISTGEKWLERFPTQQGSVLYLDLERSWEVMKDRVGKLVAARGLHLDTLPLSVVSGQSANVLTPACRQALERDLLEPLRPQVVFVDTLREFHGGEEKDDLNMHRVFAVLREWRRRYDCTFILLHHLRKIGGVTNTLTQRTRGSTVILASVESALYVEKRKNGYLLTHGKSNLCEKLPNPLRLEIVDEAGGVVVRYLGEAEKKQAEAEGDREKAAGFIRQILSDEAEGLETTPLKERLEAAGISWTTARRALEDMEEDEEVEVIRPGPGKSNRYLRAEGVLAG